MLFKLSNLNSNLALTLGYLNPALNNSARRGAASLRHRNRAAATVLVCELKPYIRCDFRDGSKATIRYSVNTP